MQLLDPAALTVVAITGAAVPRSRVTWSGGVTEVDGVILEAAVALDAGDPAQGVLLFLTDDIPFEDSLSIALVDPESRVMDRARLGGLYATGTWRDAMIDGPGRMSFGFIDERRWRLTVLAAPALWRPFAAPRGVHRPFGRRRRFVLDAT